MTQIKAELIDHMGDDLRVVNAARVSFAKESEYERVCVCGQGEPTRGFPCTHGSCAFDDVLAGPDYKLIKYLAKHNHFTPFTHSQITLREQVPIFVARQRFKHVVGFTYNEVSRRYVDETPEFYIPETWRKRAENVKQGSSEEEVHYYEAEFCGARLSTIPEIEYEELTTYCRKVYHDMIAGGICPEQARMVLPQGMMASYYVTGSLMAFARAYKQRSDSHAQREIQDLATHWDRLIRPLFPVSWSALVDPKEP